MMIAAAPQLRGTSFDIFFIVLIPLIATTVALSVAAAPQYFDLVLALNLWLLGYHHVIATYTRIAFDKNDIRENRFLLFYLPVVVVLFVVVIYFSFGNWAIATIYLHWQWYHYTRQSEGVFKACKGKMKRGEIDYFRLGKITFYCAPLVFFLEMSASAPVEFLYFPVRTIVLPELAILVLKVLVMALLFLWTLQQVWGVIKGRVPVMLACYGLSHYTIYYVSYSLIDDVNIGWLAINIWHNLQYIAFVWLFNVNKYSSDKSDSNSASLIRYISQPQRALIYFLVCVLITFIVYRAFGYIVDFIVPLVGVHAAVMLYQVVNFHHYIVDSKIWKLRRKAVSSNLGIS